MDAPRIALIHATPIAVDPVHSAFRNLWPDARPIDVMDYSLSPDRETAGRIDEALTGRIVALSRYGISTGARAVLFTCSAFGSAIERARLLADVPVLRPNEAMFEAAMAAGNRIAMICPFSPAAASMEEEFREEVARTGSAATLETVLCPGAIEAVRAGDVATHNRLVAEKAATLKGYDAITLAHFSTARALAEAQSATTTPVFSSPEAAVSKLKRILEGQHRC
jgi:Asp/Glu/hydantoin racemase